MSKGILETIRDTVLQKPSFVRNILGAKDNNVPFPSLHNLLGEKQNKPLLSPLAREIPTPVKKIAPSFSMPKMGTFPSVNLNVPGLSTYKAPTTKVLGTTIRPTGIPSPTPTPQPTNSLKDFTTAQVPQDYQKLIINAASSVKLPPALVASLLFSEHGFSHDPGYNYNSNGSYDRGPAQINSAAHPEITDAQALDPNFAIPWAAKTLASHVKNLGYKRGIVAYNTGERGSMRVASPSAHPYYQKVVHGLTGSLRNELGLE